MGLVASQARLLMLYDRKSTLEFQMQCLTTRLMAAAAQTTGIAQEQSNLFSQLTQGDVSDSKKDQINAQLGQLEAKMAKITSWNKQIELMQKNIETQHSAVQTEIESVQKVIDKNISMTFKYFNHNG